MQVKLLCEELDFELLQGSMNTEINDIIFDSRKIKNGCVFVCLRGAATDGHKYIPEAIRKKVAAIVIEEAKENLEEFNLPEHITVIRVKSSRSALALMSAAFFDYPSKKLVTVGITGTKGKTTMTYTIKSILDKAGYKSGVIGSIEADTGEEIFATKNTTPESYEIQKYLFQMVKNGCKYAIMETSSQGLMQRRTEGIVFDYGVFTNISMDHIGKAEHESFKEYLECKKILFRQCRTAVINIDCPWSKEILEGISCRIIGVSLEQPWDLYAFDIKYIFEEGHYGMTFKTRGLIDCQAEIHTPGEFSVYNVLLSMAVCCGFDGITHGDIIEGVRDVRVEGRLQPVQISPKFDIIIDYAHNEDSARNVLEALRQYSHNRLICVFGCAGNRSRKRRYGMGKVIGEIADYAVVTDENPRFEDGDKIVADIAKELDRHPIHHVEIRNRKEALAYAITNAKPGDMIVSLGKGHERYFDYGGVKTSYSEQETIKEIEREIRSGQRKMKYMEL